MSESSGTPERPLGSVPPLSMRVLLGFLAPDGVRNRPGCDSGASCCCPDPNPQGKKWDLSVDSFGVEAKAQVST